MQDLVVIQAREFDHELEIDWEIRAEMDADGKLARIEGRTLVRQVYTCFHCDKMFICIEASWQAESALGQHIRMEHPEVLKYREEQ